MTNNLPDELRILRCPKLENATLVLAFSGWMDGGDVSTGTVEWLRELLRAQPIAEIDPEPFYLLNFPGTMEMTALFRPHIKIEDGLIADMDMPSNTFYCHEPRKIVLFLGKEPNLRWRTFGDCIFRLAHDVGVRHILFVGSFGGAVPHTREPRLYVTCSDNKLLAQMQRYGIRRSDYSGPGSFSSYLMSQSKSANLDMTSLVAEIPGYLHGVNPLSIASIARRLANFLELSPDFDSLRDAATAWELKVSAALEEDEELAEKVRQLETEYDNDLLDDAVE